MLLTNHTVAGRYKSHLEKGVGQALAGRMPQSCLPFTLCSVSLAPVLEAGS